MRPRQTLQLDSFAALVAHGHLKVAQRWLHRLAEQPPPQAQLEAWVHLLTSQPTAWRLHPQRAPWIGWLLIRVGKTDLLEPYLLPLSRQEPAAQALWAQWWLWQQQPLPALAELVHPPPTGSPVFHTLWWCSRAQALHATGQPGAESDFQLAQQDLSPQQLGWLYLHWAQHLTEHQQTVEAGGFLQQAWPLCSQDPHLQSLIQYQLALTQLALDPGLSEAHCLQAAQTSHQAQATLLLAQLRLQWGEWSRALLAFEKAVDLAHNIPTRIKALYGLGESLFHLGRTDEAYVQFQLMERQYPQEMGNLKVWTALCLLQIRDQGGAQQALATAQPQTPRHQALHQLALATLAQQQGQPFDMQALDPYLPLLGQFLVQFPTPGQQGATRPAPYQITVFAGESIRALVNGRPIPLPPNSRMAELLVLLLEAGGQANLDWLLDQMYPEAAPNQRSTATRALWELVNQLRQILGWQDSLQALGGTYRLDPVAKWQYTGREEELRQED